jgi:hypothetical protein
MGLWEAVVIGAVFALGNIAVLLVTGAGDT